MNVVRKNVMNRSSYTARVLSEIDQPIGAHQ